MAERCAIGIFGCRALGSTVAALTVIIATARRRAALIGEGAGAAHVGAGVISGALVVVGTGDTRLFLAAHGYNGRFALVSTGDARESHVLFVTEHSVFAAAVAVAITDS